VANEEDMSSTQGQKTKSGSYTYSWFLPALGSNGFGTTPPTSTSEPGAPRKESPEQIAEEAIEQWRHKGETMHRHTGPGSWSLTPMRLRIGGLVAWDAVVLTGALALSARAGPIPGAQLGLLCAVWVGISGLIWFLPEKLGYRA